MTEVTFRTLPFGECADVVAAFRNSQRDTPRDATHFQWRYAGRPGGASAYVTLAYYGSEEPVAAAAVIPHHVMVAGTMIHAGKLADISVSSTMRGKGVASRLLDRLRADAFDRGLKACYALPNKDAAGALARAGFAHIGDIRRAVRLLSVRGRLERRLGGVGRAAAAVVDAALGVFDRGGRLPSGYSVATATGFDARYDELWARLPREGLGIARRDAAWLDWRFRAKPDGHYEIFELSRGGELVGFVVHHYEDGLACVDDFLALDADAADRLGRAFAGAIRAQGRADAIQVRYVEQSVLPVPFADFRYVWRADSQAVMWAGTADVPPVHAWFVTPADKDV